ncbi:MAG: glycine--tRNA ligase [Flavobacteriales bacterium]
MANRVASLKSIVSHAKKYGYVFPSSEIYDGLSAVYDYGQNGVALKDNIKRYWWKAMVQLNENIEGLDAAIFMHPTTWQASGHVDAFSDPLIDNRDTQKRYRADGLIEDYIAELDRKIQGACSRAAKRFGSDFDMALYERTNPRVKEYIEQRDKARRKMVDALERDDLEALTKLIADLGIADPVSGSKNWTDVRRFNLMFGTQLAASPDSSADLYLRPETAQGVFVNFLNVQKTARQKLPFGIAQVGKAFRNEITARQFIFRMREFEQMELQYFVRPGDGLKHYEAWKEKRMRWHLSLGLGQENYRFRDHDKLAHYADAASDIEFRFPFGFKELEGIHSRTDFDLRNHEKYANKKLQFFDPLRKAHYLPHVVETSVGLDRLFLAVFSIALQEETLADGSMRTVLRLPPILAPTQAAILPLVKKDGLPEIARALFGDLKYDFNVRLDDKDAIGRRYRRQDAAGTPYCITIDHDTRQDQSATLRNRDTMQQARMPLTQIAAFLDARISMKAHLKKL